jgi:hypothetical protein
MIFDKFWQLLESVASGVPSKWCTSFSQFILLPIRGSSSGRLKALKKGIRFIVAF